MPELDKKANAVFPGKVVRKDLVRKVKVGANVPVFVLEYLLGCPGRVVPAEELLERVWDEAADPFTTAVKQTMYRLRAKLGDPPVIETVREGGYRIGGQ